MNYPVKDALELAQTNYKEYSQYIAQGRAYPNILDGAKSSYKRAIYGMWKDAPRSIVKVAELSAYALPYHPHPTSISGVIVQLGDNGNKLKLMKTQGNWGDSSRDIQPSADRYIGGMLSDTAMKLLCDGMEYCNYITGEIDNKEPEALPALIPLCFINGSSGIPAGLPRLNIPCLNVSDMFDYYLEILSNKSLDYVPKKLPRLNTDDVLITTRQEWEQILKDGVGKITLSPKMSIKNGVITITSLPGAKDVEHIRKVLSVELAQDKVDIRDESTKDICIVVEKVYRKQCDMDAVFKKLKRKLTTTETVNMAFFDLNTIYVPCSFDKVVKANLNYIIQTHKNKILKELSVAKLKLEVLQIIEKLKLKNGNLSKLFTLDFDAAVKFLTATYKCSSDTATKVLQKPMSYLTKAHNQEIIDLHNNIKTLQNYHTDIWKYLYEKYTEVKKLVLKEMKK